MSSSSSFYHTTNPTPEDQPTLYEQLEAATAAATAAANLAKEFVVYENTWTSTVNIDWSKGMTQRVTLEGDTTFTFANARDGEKLVLELRQDGVGSHTITLPASVRYCRYIPIVELSTAPDYLDRLGFIYQAQDAKYDLVAVAYGVN